MRLPWRKPERGIAGFSMRHAASVRGNTPRMEAA